MRLLEESMGRFESSMGLPVPLGQCHATGSLGLEQSPNLTCSTPKQPTVGEPMVECNYKLPHPGRSSPVRPLSCLKKVIQSAN